MDGATALNGRRARLNHSPYFVHSVGVIDPWPAPDRVRAFTLPSPQDPTAIDRITFAASVRTAIAYFKLRKTAFEEAKWVQLK